jgi:hypothetical protein
VTRLPPWSTDDEAMLAWLEEKLDQQLEAEVRESL